MQPTIEWVTKVYGPRLETASMSNLRAILSAVALEFECRHCNGEIPDGLVDLIAQDDDRVLLTLAIAAAERLRFPIESRQTLEIELIRAA